ncbi:hypothetical protein FE782_30780 [Paenibacillus antri]|uniref:Mannosylglycerate hydrolase MGH1-like glycoside hydrolase domain-containing protein n=1 Tax=Paenibacillus antri TaxID=2582848 RepID=A0A5R9G271_9BACL|nr:hypothetical protein [Paenibacillus antri]TLS48396.1 hypothetical protein FE782_30780 [Paenibacillus antri]
MSEQLGETLDRLRAVDTAERIGRGKKASDERIAEEFAASGAAFVACGGNTSALETTYYTAMRTLLDCIVPNREGKPILQEGGVYHGCWLESTGTINVELLSRFLPSVAQATFEQFADLQRTDGLIPYKITADGAVFKQIQLVTPPARSVWTHAELHGGDERFLRKMYQALSRYDDWLATYRNTRGTGCVEAFCAFDTGHDLSPRFWHTPDTPYGNDPARCDPQSPLLPFLAPDLTASVYCSRKYLARMARSLGDDAAAAAWEAKAEQSSRCLIEHCFDETDGFFYDVDRHGRFVRIQSDVLLRVLASEVGDDAFFASSLRRYVLNTRKFFAKYPFASIAMDDPRFDPHSTYNSWAGPSNFLTLLRAPRAFELHGRHVELTWATQSIVSAVSRMTRFGQTLSPWTGEEGFTEAYSPAAICALDYVERLSGVLPTPEGELWFTALLPNAADHGAVLAESVGYRRDVDGSRFEFVHGASGGEIYRDGALLYRVPAGVRVVTDRAGELRSIVGMGVAPAEGSFEHGGTTYPIRVEGNETLRFDRDARAFASEGGPGVVPPGWE